MFGTFYLAAAQQPVDIPRIGFVHSAGTAVNPSPLFDAFRGGLQDLGYTEGKNILIESRYSEGRLDRIPELVNDILKQKVAVIVAPNNVAIRAAKKATKTIPIVIISSIDPVAAGYVESFARPGGNITGLTHLGRDLSAKRIELLNELLPGISRVSILWDQDGPGPAVAFKEYEDAARAFKLEIQSLGIRGPKPDFAGAFQAAKTARVDALIVVANPLMGKHAKQVFELATKNRLPSMTEGSRYAEVGGLISYGTNLSALYRHAATYVDGILKGANPATMLVEQPRVFEIFINIKTAKALGLQIPKGVLVRANELIE